MKNETNINDIERFNSGDVLKVMEMIKKPSTNFDRITASPEELAELMNDCADCNNCPVTEKSVCQYKYKNCKEAWVDWLNEECKE